MIIFLLSSSYIENTIIPNLEYLMGVNISEIVLLKENHTESEFAKLATVRVKLFNNIYEALTYSDLIIIDAGTVENSKINSCIKIAKMNKKIYHIINLTQAGDVLILPDEKIKSVPLIFIITLGEFHQSPSFELSINEMFNNCKVPFYQDFSPVTRSIIANFQNNHILNPLIQKSISNSNFKVAIRTINERSIKQICDNVYFVDMINDLQPDYIALICENNLLNDDDYKNILQYRFNRRINLILHSDYISIYWGGTKCPILKTNDFHISLSSREKNNVLKDIFNSITFPDRVQVL